MFKSRLKPATGILTRLFAGISLLAVSGIAAAAYELNFQRPVSALAQEVLELHNLITLIVFVIMILVTGVMLWSIISTARVAVKNRPSSTTAPWWKLSGPSFLSLSW